MVTPSRNGPKSRHFHPPAARWRIVDVSSTERIGNLPRRRRPADDRALRPHHVERRYLEFRKITLRRVLDQKAGEAAVIGLTHRRLYADLGSHAAEEKMRRAKLVQQSAQPCCVKGALPRLVDHRLAGQCRQLVDDFDTGLA